VERANLELNPHPAEDHDKSLAAPFGAKRRTAERQVLELIWPVTFFLGPSPQIHGSRASGYRPERQDCGSDGILANHTMTGAGFALNVDTSSTDKIRVASEGSSNWISAQVETRTLRLPLQKNDIFSFGPTYCMRY
jgi:hypothetical protein